MRFVTDLVAATAVLVSGTAMAADLHGRKAPEPTPPPSQACKETTGLPSDAFGFASGSDVADLGSVSPSLEYGGAFGTRFGSLYSHGLKAQISTSPLPCLEIGPSLTGSFGRSSERIGFTRTETDSVGAGVEFKYKILGRSLHGIGLTLVAEPTLSRGRERVNDPLSPVSFRNTGLLAGNTAKLLIDAELIKDRLFGAINVEHVASWSEDGLGGCAPAGGSGYCRGSSLNIRAALAVQLAENVYVGADVSHQRAYDGTFLNRYVGHAWFVGPNLFWQVNEKIAVNAAYGVQVSGHSESSPGRLNLDDFNRHVAKVKLGYAF